MTFLFVISTIVLIIVFIRVFFPLFLWRLYGLFSKKSLNAKFGETVVITGATDGIGEALALHLAHKNTKLVLIGRNPQKLDDIKQRVNNITKKPEKVQTLIADFSHSIMTDEKFKELETELKKLPVAVFIHCAGHSYPSALKVEELNPNDVENILSVNLLAAIRLTQVVLPGMKQRQKGALMYVGSGASIIPSNPLYAVYAASKAGLETFCKCLQVECASDNIVVQYQAPLFVATKLSKIRNPSLTVLSATKFAKDSIECLETAVPSLSFSVTRSPNIIHSCLLFLIKLTPYGVWSRIALMNAHRIRAKYLKKQA